MQKYSVIIIGSGAAGYSTADWLSRYGVKNIAVLTENKSFGTSRNAGSDKQTYYKMSFTEPDSAERMAEALSFGGGMHRDTAFIEAVNSTRCFMRLVEYGVPFPTDEYGRFVGYKTDHDAASRGTSAGPLTSKYMTERLEKKVSENGDIHIIDNAAVLKIVKDKEKAVGVIYITKTENGYELVPAAADYAVMATGGAAKVYANTVYPVSQSGALGLAIDAGCKMNNLTEWQYGIASVKVRWNLSGSYQQVVPAYYSVDESGKTYDFLPDSFESFADAYTSVFLKGYQWPFDSRKANGSSRVDLAVSEELKKGRKVFMDFRRNPANFDFNALSDEAKSYLINANADGETPIERLYKLNPPAIDFYKSKGIDLYKEPIEIAVCAQHINGGTAVDCNWQTSVPNLFAAGEAAGTFGIYRPGGSALNSTQVGGLRIAEYISAHYQENSADDDLFAKQLQNEYDFIENCLKSDIPQTDFSLSMSRSAAHCRVHGEIAELYSKILNHKQKKYFKIAENSYFEVLKLYKYKDNLTTQLCLCETLFQALPIVGSRGGAVYYKDGKTVPENKLYRERAIVTENGRISFEVLRSIPDLKYNFEQTWKEYRKLYKY